MAGSRLVPGAAADLFWGDAGWTRFTERAGKHRVRLLVVRGPGGAVVAVATLLVAGADTGSLFYDVAKMVGDERAYGDPNRLPPDDRAAYDELRLRLPGLRPAQNPTVSLTANGPHHGVRIAPGSPVPRSAVLAALPRLLAEAAATLGCRSTGLLHLGPDEHAAMAATAAEHGYVPVALGADAVVDLPGEGGYAGWVDGLRSRRRTRMRKELAEYREQGIRTVVTRGRDAFTDELVELQAQLRAKHGVPVDPASVRAEFDAIRDAVGDSCVVFTSERDGEVVGFALALLDPARGNLHARSAGFAPGTASAGCYFVLLYHDVPAWAVENGVRRVWYGMSTYEAKRARGCALRPLTGFLRFTGPDAGDLRAVAALQSRAEEARLADLDCRVDL